MIVLVVFPDLSAARMTAEEARGLAMARGSQHGLRFYDVTVIWDGAKDRDPYMTATAEPHRRHAAPSTTLGSPTQRVRTIQSVADLPAEQQQSIAQDGARLGPEQAGRRWNLSKQSVVRVMKLQGVHRCPPTEREQRIFSRVTS